MLCFNCWISTRTVAFKHTCFEYVCIVMDCTTILSRDCATINCVLPFPKTVAFDTQYAIHFNHLQYRFESIIAFIVIAISCKLILYLIIVTFDNIVAYQPLNIISRVLGIVLSLLMGVIIIQILTYLIALYPNAMLQGQLDIHYLPSKFYCIHLMFHE